MNHKRIRLDYSEFNPRVTNVLRNNGIDFLDQLVNLTDVDILHFRNCGKKSLRDIKKFLADNDLCLKGQSNPATIQRVLIQDLPKVLGQLREQLEKTQEDIKFFKFKLDEICTNNLERTKLFLGPNLYPKGGYQDFVGYFRSIESAKDYVDRKLFHETCMWAHMVIEDKIVFAGTLDMFFSKEWQWKSGKELDDYLGE